jgi:hypothetical protein
MNHIKCMHLRKSQQHFINKRIQLAYIGCNSKTNKQPIPTRHFIQPNKVEH